MSYSDIFKVRNLGRRNVVNPYYKKGGFTILPTQPLLYSNSAVVSFIDDDAKDSFMTLAKSVYDANGVKATISSVGAYIINNLVDSMTLSELKQLQTEGYDIVSHSINHPDFKTLTDDEVITELRNSKNWIVNNGFNSDVFIYPVGAFTDRERNLVKDYFKLGIDTNNGANGSSNTPIVSMDVKRYSMDYTSITDLKTLFDTGIAQKAWIIYWSHSWDTNFSAAKVDELIKYVKSKSVPIKTVTEAFNSLSLTPLANLELVSNGDFANGSTSWEVAGATWDFSSGKAVMAPTTTWSHLIRQWIPVTPNTTYVLSATENTGSVNVNAFITQNGTQISGNTAQISTPSSVNITTASNATYVKIECYNGSKTGTLTFDNISFKKYA